MSCREAPAADERCPHAVQARKPGSIGQLPDRERRGACRARVARPCPVLLQAGREGGGRDAARPHPDRKSTSELQSLMRISYAVFCLKKKNKHHKMTTKKAH